MSQLALYRKYRPLKWDEVLGQDNIVSMLKNEVAIGDTAHAYLFSGSRGTGKTSVARIFATEIGCSSNDLYEIDAASNRGIDDIRDLCESVRTLPFDSKYKVYIIDEAHMLTKEAFNALLKTLEEPPAHVVFLLATTEAHKMPDTVVSRCQVLHFKKPSQSILKKLVSDTSKSEGYSIDSLASDLISMIGDGSFRDTHGTLQKVISSVDGKKITARDVENITGAPNGSLVNKIILSITDKKLNLGIDTINILTENNIDAKVFIKLLLQKLRAILLLRLSDDVEGRIKDEFGEEDFLFIEKLAKENGKDITSKILRKFLGAYDEIRYSVLPHLPLELALIDIISNNSVE